MRNITLLLLGLTVLLWHDLSAQRRKKRKTNFEYIQHFASREQYEQSTNKIERLYLAMQGHFTNKRQADTATLGFYRAQELISIPIWRHRLGEYWIYQCRIPEGKPQFVVNEVIIQIKKRERDSFELHYYQFNTNHKNYYALEWLKEQPFDEVQPKDLLSGKCMSLVAVQGQDFEILPSNICEYEMSNYIRQVKREARLTWERFSFFSVLYDANGKTVFTYQKPQGLVFERLPQGQMRYDEKFLSENIR